jgi:hypothetical protein
MPLLVTHSAAPVLAVTSAAAFLASLILFKPAKHYKYKASVALHELSALVFVLVETVRHYLVAWFSVLQVAFPRSSAAVEIQVSSVPGALLQLAFSKVSLVAALAKH